MTQQQYEEYNNKEFMLRRDAEEWADEQKEKMKNAAIGVAKVNIEFNKRGNTWIARILLPV